MTKAGTSEPALKIITITAMKKWLKGTLKLDWNIPQDEEHAGLTQALAEQQQTGWNNVFKGRISQAWTHIPVQQSGYSKQNQHRTKDDPLPKHYYVLRKLVGRKPYKAGSVHEPEPLANSQ